MKKTLLFSAGTLSLASLAWSAAVMTNPAKEATCATAADVLAHQNASRHGISLTCTEAIRAQNRHGGQDG